MSLPDTVASGALDDNFIHPVYLAYLDFVGTPVLANSSGADITPSGTGITKLDGNTFLGIEGHFIDLTPVAQGSAGSKSVTASLSGLPGDSVDDVTLAILDDATKWRGRAADIWQLIRNQAGADQGGYRVWCSGRMVALNHGADDRGLQITVQIEGYLAALSEASNRTYLDQERVDPTDLSAYAAIAIANGNYTTALPGSVNPNPPAQEGGMPGFWFGGLP